MASRSPEGHSTSSLLPTGPTRGGAGAGWGCAAGWWPPWYCWSPRAHPAEPGGPHMSIGSCPAGCWAGAPGGAYGWAGGTCGPLGPVCAGCGPGAGGTGWLPLEVFGWGPLPGPETG